MWCWCIGGSGGGVGVGVGDGGGGGGVDGIDVGVGGDTAHVNALYHARRLITPQINIVWGGVVLWVSKKLSKPSADSR